MRYPMVAGLLNQMKKGILRRSALNNLLVNFAKMDYILSNIGSMGTIINSTTIKTVLK